MKGYKAFNKGLICRGKQYSENTVFEEEQADICKSGMHFCKDPLAVLDYYPLVNEDGDISEFAEVESLDVCKTDDNQKYCTKKLKIGAKISFPALVQASVNFEYDKTKTLPKTERKTISSDYAQIGSSGDYAQIGSSGYNAQIGSSGDYAQIGSSGYNAKIGSSGNDAKIGSSGNDAQIGSSGYNAKIGSSGNDAKIGSSGDYAKIGSSGNGTQIGSSGDYAKIGSSGDYAKIGSSGNGTQIGSSGYNAVICCAGQESTVKAKKGSWITLSEWKYDEELKNNIPICVKTEFVDGERIKEDTWYVLKNGEFIEQK